MSNYGERKCLVCGKAFEPELAQIVCCSPECQKQRNKEKSAEWSKIHRSGLHIRLEQLEKSFALLERFVRRVHGMTEEEMRKIYAEEPTGKEPEPEPEVPQELMETATRLANALTAASKEQQAPPTIYECERMRLKQSTPLPCGKRVECFKPKRCEKAPQDAPEVTDNYTPPEYTGGAMQFGRKRRNVAV